MSELQEFQETMQEFCRLYAKLQKFFSREVPEVQAVVNSRNEPEDQASEKKTDQESGYRCRLQIDSDVAYTLRERAFILAAAEDSLLEDGELEVDTSCSMISESDDGGEYVLAWLWISDHEAKLPNHYQFRCQIPGKSWLKMCRRIAFSPAEAKAEIYAQALEMQPALRPEHVCEYYAGLRDCHMQVFRDGELVRTCRVLAMSPDEAQELVHEVYPKDSGYMVALLGTRDVRSFNQTDAAE